MKQCKCGSFAINDDKTGEMCDKCLRDNKIKQLEKERDEWKDRAMQERIDAGRVEDRARREGKNEIVDKIQEILDEPNPADNGQMATDADTIECIREAISAQQKEVKKHSCADDGYWWCHQCEREVHARQVTFEEVHTVCGHEVEWICNTCGKQPEQNDKGEA